MPAIRVFLLTYRRPELLRRALDSLLAQTFADWVCELHNDAPDDDFPRRLVAGIADPRITLHHHERNWGPVAAFNHAYAGGPEPFLAVLEDDNWWEPDLLAEAHAALIAHPEAKLAWANMRLWRENPDRTWTDTGRTIWQTAPHDGERPRLFRWPVPLQCFDALHSHGAMLCRADASRAALVPADTPVAIIEPARERLLPGAWLLLPRPLGNFALTLATARSGDRAQWAGSQLLVAGSYLAAHPSPGRELDLLWQTLREQRPPSTGLLFHVALSGLRPCAILRRARPADWLRFLAGALCRPATLVRTLRFRSRHPALWQALLEGARARYSENPAGAPSLALFHKDLAEGKTAPHPPPHTGKCE